jgi:hypothetical protein
MMLITTTAHIKETDKIHIQDEDYRLRRPDIAVEVYLSEILTSNTFFYINVVLSHYLVIFINNCI